MHHGAAVYLHHVEKALLPNRWKLAVLTETGVVDQQIDLDPFFFGEGKNSFRSVRIRKVRGEYLSADLVSRAKCAPRFPALAPVMSAHFPRQLAMPVSLNFDTP